MKRSLWRGILLLVATFLFVGCASNDLGLSTTQSGATPVPGEKTSDEGVSGTAGPGVAGAGVRW